jgi:hypothetical protein
MNKYAEDDKEHDVQEMSSLGGKHAAAGGLNFGGAAAATASRTKWLLFFAVTHLVLLIVVIGYQATHPDSSSGTTVISESDEGLISALSGNVARTWGAVNAIAKGGSLNFYVCIALELLSNAFNALYSRVAL